ncbi:MAG: sigma-70 family RNA polymerase sigma factor [Chloroflexi bacterium]|nr:sigma-70 family RNA polymerase sigma factor [Chloroflexota bacterium]
MSQGATLPSDEEELVQRARKLDSEAWVEIYQRHFPSIYAYLLRRTGDPAVSEDLASSVFLGALERIGSFNYRGVPLVAWLFRIAHNQLVDHWRRSEHLSNSPLPEQQSNPGSSPQEELELSLLRQDLQRALAKVTEEQRQVLLLRFIHGLGIKEIAYTLNKPQGAVKALQHRGLASLRRILSRGEVDA